MNDTPRYANLRDYLRVVRARRWLIVVAALLVGGAALVYSVRQTPVYQAQASLQVRDELADFSLIGTPAVRRDTPEQEAAIAAQTVTRQSVARRVRRRLHLTQAPRSLQAAMSASAQATSNLVLVQARWTDAAFAARLANGFAFEAARLAAEQGRQRYSRAARDARRALRSMPRSTAAQQGARAIQQQTIARLEQLAQLSTPIEVQTRAQPPEHPVSPRPVLNTTVGLLVGLALGVLVAFVRDSLDRRFRGSGELRDDLELPLVGWVGDDLMGRTQFTRNGRKPLAGADIETFRILRANVEFLDVDADLRVIAVTSGLAEEGKSTVAAGLAGAFAATGRRVLLVECDLRRPVIAERLGLEVSPGLSDYLVGDASPEEVVQTITEPHAGEPSPPVGTPSIVTITAGRPTPRPAELLGSRRFAEFLDQVREAYDTVILDTAPLLSVVDTLEVLRDVDGVLLCVRTTRTTRDEARAAKAALARLSPRPTGIVVTGVQKGDELDYGYYSYAYAYGSRA